MNKITLLIIGLIFTIQTIAQNDTMGFTIQFGATTSIPKTSDFYSGNIEGEPIIKSKPNIGGFLLIATNFTASEREELEIGLGYFLDRFSIHQTIGPIESNGTRTISNIQIPLSYNYSFGESNLYQVGTGFYTNFVLSVREKGTSVSHLHDDGNIPINPDDNFNLNLNDTYDDNKLYSYNKVNFGILVELKRQLKISDNLNGFLKLRMNQDLNAIKNKDSNSFSNVEIKNEKEATTINFGFGIDF